MKVKNVLYSITLLLHISSFSAISAEVQLPQTGQVACYNASGALLYCNEPAALGQDGQKRSGTAWPESRFADNSNGTVTDKLTGLIWLKKADCFGSKSWQEALEMSNGLGSGACDLNDSSVAGDWRLPNTIELESLLDLGISLPSIPAGIPILDVTNNFYWTSTTYADDPSAAWIIDFSDAYKGSFGYKDDLNSFWPVRDAIASDPQQSPAIIQLPVSGQTTCWLWDEASGFYQAGECSGTGQDGDKKRGVVWPVPRFLDNNNGTVTDSLTGLVWLKDAGCAELGEQPWITALEIVNNLKGDNTVCGLNDASQQRDWRLPNRKELSSLLDHQYSAPAITPSVPFLNLPDETVPGYYWTSSTVDNDRGSSWLIDLFDGYAMTDVKDGQNKIWPVRNPLLNTAPVIVEGDSVTVAMSKNGIPNAFSLSLHAGDADHDQLSWSVQAAAANGVVTSAGSGDSVVVSYMPTAGFVGQDSFTVQVSDGKGGDDSIVVNVTVNQTYVVKPLVSGNGSFFPATEQQVNSGGSTTLTVSAGTDSYLSGVTGCGGVLSGNSYLTGLITGDCSVLAEFKVTRVKVQGNAVRTDFNTLQEAYSYPSTSGDMILKAQATVFTEGLTLDRPIYVTLSGGYDSMFQSASDFSTVEGGITIGSGSVQVDRVIIR